MYQVLNKNTILKNILLSLDMPMLKYAIIITLKKIHKVLLKFLVKLRELKC